MRTFHTTILLLVLMLPLTACKDQRKANKEATEAALTTTVDTANFTPDQYALAAIQTGSLEYRSMTGVIRATGSLDVEPHHLVTISAPLGGYIKSAGLLPGERIRKGQVLATLENPEFITLQQDYLESKARLTYLQGEFQRQEELRKEDVNAAKTLQQVTADYHSMQARVNGLEQKIRLAGLCVPDPETGKIVPTASLYAPIDGYITVSNVNIGKYVNPTDVLFELTNTSDIHLALNVFEKDIPDVQPGQSIRYALANETTFNRTAVVFLIGKATDGSGTIPVHCHLTGPRDPHLLPGMYVKAQIFTDPRRLPVVPAAAVVQNEGKDYVFVELARAGDNYRFKLVPVRRGLEEEGYVQVTIPPDSIPAGAAIVTRGGYAILSAMRNMGEE